MTKKTFTNFLARNQENKKNSNLETENTRLREKIEELQNVLKQSENDLISKIEVPLSEVKIYRNARTELKEIEELASSIKEFGQLQPVLLSSDGFLLAGHRRYEALKLLSRETIFVHYYNKTLENITQFLDVLQFEENERRKALDNFDISKIFNRYLDNGYSQHDISLIFKKTKGFVSSVIALKDIDEKLVEYLKQFQNFAYSELLFFEKFTTVNSDKLSEDRFYQKNRGVIGWNILYNIAKQETVSEQKEIFLKKYWNRLTEQELESKYFKKEYLKLLNKKENKYDVVLGHVDNLKRLIDEIKENISDNEYEDFNAATNYLLELESIVIKHSEKLR